jgi:hypothetical protein
VASSAPHDPGSRRRAVAAVALDAGAIATTLRIAAPFLLAATVGWLVGRVWRSPFGWSAGVTVWVATVAIGMVLRHTAFDRGTALPFVIVASTFTMCALLGWRAVARWSLARDRSSPK